MEIWEFVNKFFLHLDTTLGAFVAAYHVWTYPILFLIVFCETGLVFTPFLPGDSLIFAAGTLANGGQLNAALLFVLLSAAAIIGDTVNYWIGKYLGEYILHRHPRWIRKEHLDQTHAFFEKYGGKTIIIARFVPIVRTVAPFVAGLGAMTYRKFLAYNVIGGLMWVTVCLGAGYLFANWKPVKEHFSLVILAIVIISVIPGVVGYLNTRAHVRRVASAKLPE
jgi:membrane-associated protein